MPEIVACDEQRECKYALFFIVIDPVENRTIEATNVLISATINTMNNVRNVHVWHDEVKHLAVVRFSVSKRSRQVANRLRLAFQDTEITMVLYHTLQGEPKPYESLMEMAIRMGYDGR